MTFNSNLKEKTGTPVRDLGEGCVTSAHMFTQRDIEKQEIKEKRGRGGRGGGGRVALALTSLFFRTNGPGGVCPQRPDF